MRGPEGASVQQCTGATRHALEPLAEPEGEVAGLLHGPLARRAGGDPAEVHPAGAVLDEHQDIQSLQQHGVHVQEGRLRGSRLPGRAGTAARPGPYGAAPDRCLRRAGSPRWRTARQLRRVSSVRHGSGGVPTADSPLPGERQGGRCSGPSAGGRACAACSCRTSSRPACDARPAASRA